MIGGNDYKARENERMRERERKERGKERSKKTGERESFIRILGRAL